MKNATFDITLLTYWPCTSREAFDLNWRINPNVEKKNTVIILIQKIWAFILFGNVWTIVQVWTEWSRVWSVAWLPCKCMYVYACGHWEESLKLAFANEQCCHRYVCEIPNIIIQHNLNWFQCENVCKNIVTASFPKIYIVVSVSQMTMCAKLKKSEDTSCSHTYTLIPHGSFIISLVNTSKVVVQLNCKGLSF